MRFLLIIFLFLNSTLVFANEKPSQTLNFYYGIDHFVLPLKKYPEYLLEKKENENLNQKDACYFEENENQDIQDNKVVKNKWEINEVEFLNFLEKYIEPKINKNPETVKIYRENEKIKFEGRGVIGSVVDRDKLLILVNRSLEENIKNIQIPVVKNYPEILVEDEELKNRGIVDIIEVGESDFSGSPYSRIVNIKVAINKFNGYIIPKSETMSFNKVLGRVSAREGYRQELVIVGPKLERQYGGGVCQVSTTMFRTAFLSGLPIVERHPHSYAVSYYEPWGTDASIYIGGKDFKFKNNTEGDILVQTSIDEKNKKLKFHFYGTRPQTTVKIFKKPLYDFKSPLKPRYETSKNIPKGKVEILSYAVSGFKSEWLRVVEDNNENNFYRLFSRYSPRGIWQVRGE